MKCRNVAKFVMVLITGFLLGIFYRSYTHESTGISPRDWYRGQKDIQYTLEPFLRRISYIINYPKQFQMPDDMADLYNKLNGWRSIGRVLKEIASEDGYKLSNDNNQCYLQDHWGNEIYYLVSEDGIIACVTAGPNKIWECGKGDDLVVETNMKLSKKLPLPDPPTDSTPVTHPMP